MALKKCRECGGQVSTDAKTCPHCGATDPLGTTRQATIGCLTVILIAGGVIWAFNSWNDSSQKATPDKATAAAVAVAPSDADIVNGAYRHVVDVQGSVDAARAFIGEYVSRAARGEKSWAERHADDFKNAYSSAMEAGKEAAIFKATPLRNSGANTHFQAAVSDFNAWGLWDVANLNALPKADFASAITANKQMDTADQNMATDFLLTYKDLGTTPPVASAVPAQ